MTSGRLPAWCDSHTHVVFASSREEEFIDKIKGLSYAEIAAILNRPRNAIKSAYHQARETLRQQFAGRFNPTDIPTTSQTSPEGAVDQPSGQGG